MVCLGFLLKYLSIKDGLKQVYLRDGIQIQKASKVPVHKRWIETSADYFLRVFCCNLLKYLSIKDGLKQADFPRDTCEIAPSKVPVHKRWIETFF